MDYEELYSGDHPVAPSATILVVDDDPSIVHLIKEDLEAAGYKVSCGYDGQMAVQMANQLRPDLIILDVNMPMTSGLNAFKFLREAKETCSIPVIFVSGELSKDIFPVIAKAPRVAHLKKPMDLEHLNSMVRQFLSQYPIHA